jgi:hypothetical protein
MKVTITESHLDKSLELMADIMTRNRFMECPIALASRDVFPTARVVGVSTTLAVRTHKWQNWDLTDLGRQVRDLFDDGNIEELRKMLPVTIDLVEVAE